MQTTTFTGYRLTNTQPGHFKQYTILIGDDGTLVLAWGRIGAEGQVKSQKLPSREDAEGLGLRQLYDKQAKGYESKVNGLKFSVRDLDITPGLKARALLREFARAQEDPQFQGDQQAVVTHYDELVAKAQKLLDTAGTQDFDAVFAQFEDLDNAWKAIEEKHAEVQVTIGFLRQTLHQRLMGGSLL